MPKKRHIDYSQFALAKTKPIRSAKHLAYVRTLPCCVCGNDQDIQAHHLTHIRSNGISVKSDDSLAVPLCGENHYLLHWMGERSYWKERNLDPKIFAALLWDNFQKKGDVSTP